MDTLTVSPRVAGCGVDRIGPAGLHRANEEIRSREAEERGARADQKLPHHAFSIGLAWAPATVPPPLRTGSLIDAGRGLGRSKMLRNGMSTMKKPK